MTRFLIRCSCALMLLTILVLASEGHEPAGWFYTPPPYPFYSPPPYPFYSPPPYPFYTPPPYPFYSPPTGRDGQPFFTPLEKLRPLGSLNH